MFAKRSGESESVRLVLYSSKHTAIPAFVKTQPNSTLAIRRNWSTAPSTNVAKSWSDNFPHLVQNLREKSDEMKVKEKVTIIQNYSTMSRNGAPDITQNNTSTDTPHASIECHSHVNHQEWYQIRSHSLPESDTIICCRTKIANNTLCRKHSALHWKKKNREKILCRMMQHPRTSSSKHLRKTASLSPGPKNTSCAGFYFWTLTVEQMNLMTAVLLNSASSALWLPNLESLGFVGEVCVSLVRLGFSFLHDLLSSCSVPDSLIEPFLLEIVWIFSSHRQILSVFLLFFEIFRILLHFFLNLRPQKPFPFRIEFHPRLSFRWNTQRYHGIEDDKFA